MKRYSINPLMLGNDIFLDQQEDAMEQDLGGQFVMYEDFKALLDMCSKILNSGRVIHRTETSIKSIIRSALSEIGVELEEKC